MKSSNGAFCTSTSTKDSFGTQVTSFPIPFFKRKGRGSAEVITATSPQLLPGWDMADMGEVNDGKSAWITTGSNTHIYI